MMTVPIGDIPEKLFTAGIIAMPPVLNASRGSAIPVSTSKTEVKPCDASATHGCAPMTAPPAGAVGTAMPAGNAGKIAAELLSSAYVPFAFAVVIEETPKTQPTARTAPPLRSLLTHLTLSRPRSIRLITLNFTRIT
jgi:hypothetical protein